MSAGNLQVTAKKRQVYLNIRLLKDSVTTSRKTPRYHYKDSRITAVLVHKRCARCVNRGKYMKCTVWVKCRAFGCYSRWYIYLTLCFTGARECSTKYTSAYLTLHLLGFEVVLFGRRVQPFAETRSFLYPALKMEALGPCDMLLHVHRNTLRHVADDRKIAQPQEEQISADHSFPTKQCLFRVTWIALFLNQRLYHSCWRRLMLSRRHLRVGRQTFTIFSVSPGSQRRGSYDEQWKSGNQAEASLIRQRLSACVRTDVCEWKHCVPNKWRTARHLSAVIFCFPLWILFCQS